MKGWNLSKTGDKQSYDFELKDDCEEDVTP
jgi:hypothetical protein